MRKLFLLLFIVLAGNVYGQSDDLYPPDRPNQFEQQEIDLRTQLVKFNITRTLGLGMQLLGGVVYAIAATKDNARPGIILGSALVSVGFVVNLGAGVHLKRLEKLK